MVVHVVHNKDNALMGIFRNREDAERWVNHTEEGYDEYKIENIVVIEEYKPLSDASGTISYLDKSEM